MKKNTSGFTLLEMIITISIAGILAAIVVVSMSPTRIAAKVEAAQKEVASEITLAKTYALQGKTQEISGVQKTPCGYGVYFSSDTQYKIYYKTIADCENANGNIDNRRHSTGSPVDLTEKTLPGGVTAISGMDIYFTVPNARVHNAGNEFSGSMDIILTASDISKNVSVSGLGLVIIEE